MSRHPLATVAIGVVIAAGAAGCSTSSVASIAESSATIHGVPEVPANFTGPAVTKEQLDEIRRALPLPETLPELTVVEAANVGRPFNDLLSPRGQQAERRAVRVEEAIQRCMNDKGFDYTPYYGDPEVEENLKRAERPPHIDSEAEFIDYQVRVARSGLPGTPQYSGTDEPHGIDQMPKEQGEAFETALYGYVNSEAVAFEDLEEHAEAVADAASDGCRTVGREAVYGDQDEWSELRQHVEDLAGLAYDAVEFHPEVIATAVVRDKCFNAWMSPLDRLNFDARVYAEPHNEPLPADMQEGLLERAKVEAQCEVSSGHLQKEASAMQVAEQYLEDNNPDVFTDFRAILNNA